MSSVRIPYKSAYEMKRLLLTTTACLLAGLSFSQSRGFMKLQPAGRNPEDIAILQSMLHTQMMPQHAAKTTTQKKRLIANSLYWMGDMIDSSLYTYSGSRGSVHPNFTSYYDNYRAYLPNIAYGGQNLMGQQIFSDKTYRWSVVPPASNLTFSLSLQRTYDAANPNRVLSQLDSNDSWMYEKYDLTYDAAGRLTSFVLRDTIGSGTLTPKEQTYIVYDAAGRRISDSTVYVADNSIAYKTDYDYNSAGQMTARTRYDYSTDGWTVGFKFVYRYQNGQVASATSYFLDDDETLQPSWKDSFEYAGNQPQYTRYRTLSYDAQMGLWMPMSMEINYLNAQGLVDTFYLCTATGSNTYDTTERDFVVYDADGLAQYAHGFRRLSPGVYESQPSAIQRFYYETYTATNVFTPASFQPLKLYPNPASDRISWEGMASDAYTLQVFSSDGRLVVHEVWNGRSGSVQIKDWPAGTYLLIATDKQSGKAYRNLFVHQ